jgi:hypothetical protein
MTQPEPHEGSRDSDSLLHDPGHGVWLIRTAEFRLASFEPWHHVDHPANRHSSRLPLKGAGHAWTEITHAQNTRRAEAAC